MQAPILTRPSAAAIDAAGRRGEAYTHCLHGILGAQVEDVDAGSVVNAQQAGVRVGQALPRGGERVSLTVRRVLRTHSLGIRL